MTKIKDIIDSYGFKLNKIKKVGKATFLYTDRGSFVYKDDIIDDKILSYLNSRNFDYMPLIINNGDYKLTTFIEGHEIPLEKKAIDLINIVSLLHSKTTYYKEVDLDTYEKLYEDIDNNLNYLYFYYTDLITLIESKVFYSPSEILLARNISKIYDTITSTKKRLDQWHMLVKSKTKERNVVIHNNLRLSHFISGDKPYLISWVKAKIGSPVFDLYKFYNNHALDVDFESLIKAYEKKYPFTKDEKELFLILISLPSMMEFGSDEYENCKRFSRILDRIYKTEKLLPKDLTDTTKE